MKHYILVTVIEVDSCNGEVGTWKYLIPTSEKELARTIDSYDRFQGEEVCALLGTNLQEVEETSSTSSRWAVYSTIYNKFIEEEYEFVL